MERPYIEVIQKSGVSTIRPTSNESEFRRVVSDHQERVYSTCYRFLRSREDAQDVSQDVFIQVYKSLDDFRGEAQLSTWIYRIAVTKSLDLIRKQNRKRRLGSVKAMLRIGSDEGEVDVPDSTTPETEFMDADRNRILARAVAKLPENQRVAITLSNYEDYSNREIADILNTSVSAIEGLLHRGRKNLKKHLTGHFTT